MWLHNLTKICFIVDFELSSHLLQQQAVFDTIT